MWSEKYRFKNIDQFVGNEQSRLDVIKWIKNLDKRNKTAYNSWRLQVLVKHLL